MRYLSSIFLLFLPFIILSQTIAEDEDSASLFHTKEQSEVACYRIPALVTSPNGVLIAAIDERVPNCNDLRANDDINIVIRTSKDNGKTWSAINKIVDYPIGQSASDPSFIVDTITNTIFLFFNYMDLMNENGIYYLKVMESKDDGLTWSAPKDITKQITKQEWKKDFQFITSGRGIQTKSGRLLHTLVNLQQGLHVFESNDHGKRWQLIDTPILPGDESKIIELSDGTWMINSRVAEAGCRYVHHSTDQGKTWETSIDSTLIDPACNASILSYKDSKTNKEILLFSNAHSPNKRENLSICVSYDQGKTWPKKTTIYKGSAAYSSMTILPNGDIGIFFEKDDYSDNVFIKIPFND